MEIALHKTFIRIKNWSEYQHYKDRSAPWIKLHKELLSSHFWVMGSDASKLLAICIMLLAQRTDNKIPMDSEYIKRFGHLESNPDLNPLIDAQLIEFINDGDEVQDASKLLASRSTEEREIRIEEREKKHSASAPRKPEILFPPEISDQLKQDFLAQRKAKKSPLTQTALDGIKREATKAGMSLKTALEMCCQRGWAGFKAEWAANQQQASPVQSIHEKRANTIAYLTGAIKDEQERDITGESSRIYENS